MEKQRLEKMRETNENIKIEDNFLKQEDFDKVQYHMTHDNFPWYFRDRYYEEIGSSVTAMEPPKFVLAPELNEFQFVDDNSKLRVFEHIFYEHYAPISGVMEHLECLLQKNKLISIMKIRANLLTRLPSIVEFPLHTDMQYLPEETQKQWITSIFYVNTNDGYTVFEDGMKVESVANRMLTFPANMNHAGTSCTNKQARIVINFNYYTV